MYQPCDKCKDSEFPGYLKKRIKGDKEGSLSPCKCKLEYSKRLKLKLLLRQSNLPLSILDLSFNDYLGDRSKKNIEILKKYIKNFGTENSNPFLYLWGDPGTQKTTLASIVGKEIIKVNKQVSILYIENMDIIVSTLGSFKKNEEQIELEGSLLNCDVLIIDEAFFKKYSTSVSDYHITNIRYVLKHRMEVEKKPTIFISNISPIQINKHGFPRAIEDMIIRNCREQILKFEDNYLENQNDFDINNFQLY